MGPPTQIPVSAPKSQACWEHTAHLQELVELSWGREHLDMRAGDPELWNHISDPLEPMGSLWAQAARRGREQGHSRGEQRCQEQP